MTVGTEEIRVGVVGCGFFGGLHAAKYAAIDAARLTGVADIEERHAARLAQAIDCCSFQSAEQLLGHVDAVSITTPASSHYELARMFLNEGVHVLVEKPIALKRDHADELSELAATCNRVLQVGHQERFVIEHLGILDRESQPLSLTSVRAGPFTGRSSDVCAIMDLMIHDLDLTHVIMGENVTAVEARGRSAQTPFTDEADVHLEFENGGTADMTASRISAKKRRTLTVHYQAGDVEIDFLTRTMIDRTKNDGIPQKWEDELGSDALNDPLGFGVRAFVESIRDGRPPRVSGTSARRALQTALRITDRLAA